MGVLAAGDGEHHKYFETQAFGLRPDRAQTEQTLLSYKLSLHAR